LLGRWQRAVFLLVALALLAAGAWFVRELGRGAQSIIQPPAEVSKSMIYTFKSKATGDVIMLGPNGDQVMTLVGRQPAAKGIFEVKDLPQLIQTLEAAVAADGNPAAGAKQADEERDADKQARVALRARIWPLVEMMRRALSAKEPIVWGV
jgi:Domain of unknown function (DUF1840)